MPASDFWDQFVIIRPTTPINGRDYKVPTVLDEFTRQALAVTVRTKMRDRLREISLLSSL